MPTEPKENRSTTSGLSLETWKKVIKAIEDSIPLYDQVNDRVSFGQAQIARTYAVEKLAITDDKYVLDGGIGPGTASKLILSRTQPSMLVGLDGSFIQLRTARQNLDGLNNSKLHLVRGSFEFLPFRDNVFGAVITSYALRDSLDLARSIGEYSRVCFPSGSFADVDMGKPDNILKRAASVIYVSLIMPLIAKRAIRGKMKGNPWRMISPTYTTLPTNRRLVELFKQKFVKVEIKEFLRGGVIVIIGRKASN